MNHEPGLGRPLNLRFTDHPWFGPAILLIAGAIQTLTFSPFHLWWLGPLSVFLIVLVTLHQASEKLFRAGWFIGLGLFGSGASWIYISISEHGNTSVPVAVLLMVLFIAGLALFHGLAFWFWGKLAKESMIRRLLLFPAIWVLGDWLRGWLLTGFPWLYLGTAHTDGPLGGLAPSQAYMASPSGSQSRVRPPMPSGGLFCPGAANQQQSPQYSLCCPGSSRRP